MSEAPPDAARESAAEPGPDDRRIAGFPIDAGAAAPEPEARGFVDPENLALRAAPQGIVRFRKGLLIGAVATGLALLAALSWFALDPSGLRLAAARPDPAAGASGTIPDELEGLPQGYGAGTAPPLGPPLPGDLGRSILAHQRASEQGPATSTTSGAARDAEARVAAAERQRIMAEQAQARSAPVLMRMSGAGAREREDNAPAATGSGAQASLSPPPDDANVNRNRLTKPASPWLVSAGSTIAASLITGVNSDLPGMIVAQVTEPVFDSATGLTVLIPQGSRLLGRYDSNVAFGQRRAMLVWERLVLPDGSSIALDNAPATDAAGYAGVSDRVDLHTWQMLKGIGFSTLLSIGTQLRFDDGESDLARALREAVQSGSDRAGQKLVERNLDVAPTITIRPGFPVMVLVHKDLVLPPWRG